jgi:hypothetical protein
MFSRATILRPVDPAAAPELAERVVRFYGAYPEGGAYLLVDTWATLDLRPYGFWKWQTIPFMVRAPGIPPGPRTNLDIREARSAGEIAGFVGALVEGFGVSGLTNVPTSQVMDERVLADGSMRCWVAYRDGRPVGTSVAYNSDGVVGAYLVGVVPAMRRKGFGEALTWHATLSVPALPCTLQASSLGRPVYERMGYVAHAQCTMWMRAGRQNI